MSREKRKVRSSVNPTDLKIIAEYRSYAEVDADFRIKEVHALIAELYVLARRKGRPKKEIEVEKYAA